MQWQAHVWPWASNNLIVQILEPRGRHYEVIKIIYIYVQEGWRRKNRKNHQLLDRKLRRGRRSIRFDHWFDVEFTCFVWWSDHGTRCHIPKSLFHPTKYNELFSDRGYDPRQIDVFESWDGFNKRIWACLVDQFDDHCNIFIKWPVALLGTADIIKALARLIIINHQIIFCITAWCAIFP